MNCDSVALFVAYITLNFRKRAPVDIMFNQNRLLHGIRHAFNCVHDFPQRRLTFPPLTEERRKALAKDIAKLAEDAKVAIRSIRRDAIEKLKAQKKANEITEDDQKEAEKNIQKLTDKYCDEVDKLSEEKKKEIMSI